MATACTNGLDTGFVDLGYMKVAVLGVVQGVTELLPISSTAHMRIVPALFGWKDPGSAFSAAMQLAALAAVVSYFWSDIRALAEGSVRALVRRDFSDWTLRFVIWIALATVPIGIAGLALSHTLNTCGSPLRTLPVIGISCIVMAALLAIAELYCNHKRTLEHVSLKDAMIVGFAQVGALIPGVSRSGSNSDRGALSRPEARRSGAIFVSSRPPGDRPRGAEGIMGVAQGAARFPRLGGADAGALRRVAFRLCRDLGLAADFGTLLRLALRLLSRLHRNRAARRLLRGLSRLAPNPLPLGEGYHSAAMRSRARASARKSSIGASAPFSS